MHNTIIIPLETNLAVESIQRQLRCEIGSITISSFPDGESHLQICCPVANKTVFLLADLSHPNAKILNVLFITNAIKQMKAKRVILITPYLPYMRQDSEFHPGEIVSARIFANILSRAIDGLITIDPHLHRIHQLKDIYPLPVISTLHATGLVADWITANFNNAFLLGPDEESYQWLNDVANHTQCNFAVAKKVRLGDRKVEITLPDSLPTNKPIVIIDDIISSGGSILTLADQLAKLGIQQTSCIAVHALFNNDMYDKLLNAGLRSIISTNSIPHFTNKIDVTPLITAEILKLSTAFTA